jgi:hypothetical protein
MSVAGSEKIDLRWCQDVTPLDKLEKRIAAVHHRRQRDPGKNDPAA